MSLKTFFNRLLFADTIDQSVKPIILDREFGITEESIYKRFKLTPYSPDRLITKKRFEIFNEMLNDSQVESCISALKTMRLATKWRVVPASDDNIDIQIAKFVEENLSQIEGSFEDDLKEIMSALEFGWSLSEINWTIKQNPKIFNGKRMYWLKSIKSKNPKYFNINVDDYDNILENGVVSITLPRYGYTYPKDKFVIYSFNRRFENIFGTSRLRALYDLWWMKTLLKRAWSIYLERFSQPLVEGKYPSQTSVADQNALMEILKKIRLESVVTLPADMEVVFHEVSGRGAQMYENTIRYIDEQITKTIMGQTLTQGQFEVGSYSMAKIHFNILVLYLEELGRDIETKAVNPQIVNRLVDVNFGKNVWPPKWEFNPITTEDIAQKLQVFLQAINQGVLTPTDTDKVYFRTALGLPEVKPTEVLPAEAPIALKPVHPQPEAEIKTVPAYQPSPVLQTKEQIKLMAEGRKLFTGVARRKFTKYEENIVDFDEVLDNIETYGVEKTTPKISEYLTKSVSKLLEDIKKVIETKNIDAIDELSMKHIGDIRREYEDMIDKAFQEGIRLARKEIRNKKATQFQEPRIGLVDIRPLVPEEAIKVLKKKAFVWAGIDSDYLLNTAKNHIVKAMKEGWSLKDVVDEVQKSLEPYFRRGLVEEEAYSGYRIETKVRTYYAEALNDARRNFFESPENVDFVVAYQYSAILDDRVRPTHEALDGRIYAVTSDIWGTIYPPNGYNCRCVVVPITVLDEWEESPRPPTRVIETIANEKRRAGLL